jgi:hypothetical protein
LRSLLVINVFDTDRIGLARYNDLGRSTRTNASMKAARVLALIRNVRFVRWRGTADLEGGMRNLDG